MPATLSELLSQRIVDARDEYVTAVHEQATAKASLKEAEIKVVRTHRSIEAFQSALDFEKARMELM